MGIPTLNRYLGISGIFNEIVRSLYLALWNLSISDMIAILSIFDLIAHIIS